MKKNKEKKIKRVVSRQQNLIKDFNDELYNLFMKSFRSFERYIGSGIR